MLLHSLAGNGTLHLCEGESVFVYVCVCVCVYVYVCVSVVKRDNVVWVHGVLGGL